MAGHHGSLIIYGPNYGDIQLNTLSNVQAVSVSSAAIGEPVAGLRELLHRSDVDLLDREEVEAALSRIEQLATKEKSPSVTTRVKEKLDLVSGILSVGKELASLAEPHIASVSQYFGLI